MDCDQNHEECKTRGGSNATAWYPTRLLEVTDQHIRLIVCAHDPPVSPYATMSHCWGGATILTCTTQTFEALQQEIRYDTLPLTFKHAITTVRSLGIRYIWIDSLCIIQDSKEDWRTEATTMGDVYQHAFLNLAATHGKDSHAGLFSSQDPLTSSGVFQVDDSSEPGDGGVIDMIVAKDVGVPFAPLGTRGWVLQERLLSGRIVHFADGYALWDCAQRTVWQLAPRGDPSAIAGSKAHSPYLKRGPDPLMDGNLRSAWGNIVRNYTRCNFTVQSDKLIAISGIAKILQKRFGDQYLQGLWRTDLEEQLCWQAWGPRNGARIEHIPSWTWASLSDTKILVGSWLTDWKANKAVNKPGMASVIDVNESLAQIRIRCVCYAMTVTTTPVWNADFKTEFTIPSVLPHVPFMAVHDTTDTKCGNDLVVAIMFAGDRAIIGLLLEPVEGAIGTYTRRGCIEQVPPILDIYDAENKPWYKKYLAPTPGECTKCREHDDQAGCLITLV